MADAALKLPPLMTVTEFLDWPGDGTDTRYELVDGVLRAMAPASDAHGTIMLRLGHILIAQLDAKKSTCRVVGAPGIQPHLGADWNFRIPDLGVTCSPNRQGEIMMPLPVLLVEVLSPGNASKTWENVRAYSTLPSVREILVLHQGRIRAELLLRDQAGHWPSNSHAIEAGGTVTLTSIDVGFAIQEAYIGTHLEAG